MGSEMCIRDRHTIHESSEALQAKKLGHYSLEMVDVRAEKTQSVEAYRGVFEGVGPFLAVDSCNCSSLADPCFRGWHFQEPAPAGQASPSRRVTH